MDVQLNTQSTRGQQLHTSHDRPRQPQTTVFQSLVKHGLKEHWIHREARYLTLFQSISTSFPFQNFIFPFNPHHHNITTENSF